MARDGEVRTRLILEGEDDGATQVLEDVAEQVEEFVDDVGDAAGGIKGKFAGAFSGLTDTVNTSLAGGIVGVSSILSTTFDEGAKLAVNVMGDTIGNGLVDLGVDPELAMNLQRFSEGMVETLTGPLIGGVTTKIADLGMQLGEKVMSSGVGAALSGVMGTLGTAAGAVMNLAIAAAPLLLPALLIAGIIAAIALIINDPSIPGKALDIGVGIVRGILEGIVGLASGLLGIFSTALGGVITAVTTFVADVVAFIVGIPGLLVEFAAALALVFTGIWTTIIESVVTFVGDVVEFIVGIPGKLADFVVEIVDLFAGIGGDILEGVGTLVGDVVEAILGIPGALVDLGSQIVTTIINGLTGLPGQLLGAIGSAFTSAFQNLRIDVGPFHISGSGITIDMPTIDLPKFATGAWDLPRDMVAVVHKGEMIVPAGLAQAVRSGDASVGSGGGSGGVAIAPGAIVIQGGSDSADVIANKVLLRIQREMSRQSISTLQRR